MSKKSALPERGDIIESDQGRVRVESWTWRKNAQPDLSVTGTLADCGSPVTIDVDSRAVS